MLMINVYSLKESQLIYFFDVGTRMLESDSYLFRELSPIEFSNLGRRISPFTPHLPPFCSSW